MPDPAPRRLDPLAVTLLSLGVYLAGMRYVGSGDTLPAEQIPISLLQEGDVDLDEHYDPAAPLPSWVRRSQGKVRSSYPLVPALVNLPVHAAAFALGMDLRASSPALSMITASMVSAASVGLVLATLSALGLSRRAAWLLSLAYAFGTCLWSVACRGMWQHGPDVLFLAGAFHAMVASRPLRAGILVGLATVTRPTNGAYLVALAAAGGRKPLPRLVAGASLPALGLAAAEILAWGELPRGRRTVPSRRASMAPLCRGSPACS